MTNVLFHHKYVHSTLFLEKYNYKSVWRLLLRVNVGQISVKD